MWLVLLCVFVLSLLITVVSPSLSFLMSAGIHFSSCSEIYFLFLHFLQLRCARFLFFALNGRAGKMLNYILGPGKLVRNRYKYTISCTCATCSYEWRVFIPFRPSSYYDGRSDNGRSILAWHGGRRDYELMWQIVRAARFLARQRGRYLSCLSGYYRFALLFFYLLYRV